MSDDARVAVAAVEGIRKPETRQDDQPHRIGDASKREILRGAMAMKPLNLPE